QATQLLLVQVALAPQGWPLATQAFVCALQQPALQAPLQHICCGPPQPAHWPVLRHRSPPLQVELVETQAPRVASQQPPVQVAPAQHGSPAAPQATHTRLEHRVPAPVQVSPVQQGSPAAPQATQVLLAHSVLGAEQLPPQQAWPAPPQPEQAPFAHMPK